MSAQTTRAVAVMFPQWSHDSMSRDVVSSEVMSREFEVMVRRITDIAPLVEVAAPGLVVFSARGPSRYFGGDESMAEKVFALCAEASSTDGGGSSGSRGVGVAGSRFAAVAAARLSVSRGHACVVDDAVTRDFVGALPVVALAEIGGIDPDVVDLLVRLGLPRCRDVCALGEETLIDRFGLEGRRVHLLVDARDVEHLAPGPPPSDFARTVVFDDPLVTSAAVVGSARDVIDGVLAAVAGHGLQCVRLSLTCETDHAERSQRIWGEPRGFTASAACRRLAVQLDGWLTDDTADPDAPTGGVVRLEVTPVECRESLVVQPLLWGGQQENVERAARAVAMARAAVPDVVVSVPCWEGGRDLARAWSLVDASLVDFDDVVAAEERVHVGNGAPRTWTGATPIPSPAAVAVEPPTVRVVDATGSEVSVTGRHEFSALPAVVEVGGHEWRVERAAGPWPVEERWWDPRRRRRHARAQVLVRHPRFGVGVFLLGIENGAWSLLGRYD